MKSLAELKQPIKEALLSVTENVGEFEPLDGTTTHVVFQLDTEPSSLSADNTKLEREINGSIDLYALHKDIGMPDQIEQALNETQVIFHLNTILSGDGEKRQFIHFEWIFEVT